MDSPARVGTRACLRRRDHAARDQQGDLRPVATVSPRAPRAMLGAFQTQESPTGGDLFLGQRCAALAVPGRRGGARLARVGPEPAAGTPLARAAVPLSLLLRPRVPLP